jgi:hypothetical protein
MRQRHRPFCPRLEALENRLCPSSTTILPISTFLAQQGSTMLFTPPVRDQIAWINSAFDPGSTSTDAERLLLVDYTGLEAAYLLQHGINLHTQVSGFVTETPVGTTGLMEVSVNLQVTNALTWAAEVPAADEDTPAVNTDPLELGYRVQDLVANPSLKPALSDGRLNLTFQEQVGAPLPDMVQAFILGSAPAGFAPERIAFQSWGTGTLDAGTTVGTPGQAALVSTSQVADFTNASLPGTHPDGFWQEPVDLVPVASASAHVGYLNGTLFISDTSSSNDAVAVVPTASGGAVVVSNLGSGTFPSVTRLIVGLGNGNNVVRVGNLPAVTMDVSALGGNNVIVIGDAAKLVVAVGNGNHFIATGDTNPAAQFIFVSGNGNNVILADNASPAEIIVAGNGNNLISASGTSDFIEVLGNGNNLIVDTGTSDLVRLGGDGNNDIQNDGAGSMTVILAGKGHNHVH